MIWYGLFWFVLGLGLGGLIGVALPWEPLIHPWKVGHVEKVHPKHAAESSGETSRRVWSVVTALSLWLAVVAAGVGLYGAFFLAAPRAELRDYVACQAAYDTQLVEGIRERAEAFAETDEALDAIVEAVAEDGPDALRERRIRAALAHYRAVRAAQEATIRENPPPPLPEQVCGELPEDAR